MKNNRMMLTNISALRANNRGYDCKKIAVLRATQCILYMIGVVNRDLEHRSMQILVE